MVYALFGEKKSNWRDWRLEKEIFGSHVSANNKNCGVTVDVFDASGALAFDRSDFRFLSLNASMCNLTIIMRCFWSLACGTPLVGFHVGSRAAATQFRRLQAKET